MQERGGLVWPWSTIFFLLIYKRPNYALFCGSVKNTKYQVAVGEEWIGDSRREVVGREQEKRSEGKLCFLWDLKI